jgi:hypothetical protein
MFFAMSAWDNNEASFTVTMHPHTAFIHIDVQDCFPNWALLLQEIVPLPTRHGLAQK